MYKKKTLQELTLKDNFLFAAVMMERENCRHLLELLLRGISYEELRNRIVSVKDTVVLGQLLKYAVQATTISEFDSMMNL